MANPQEILDKTNAVGMEERKKQRSIIGSNGTFLQQFQNATTSGDKWNAAIGAGIAGINGLTNIASNVMNASRIRETPEFDNQIGALNLVGTTDYLTNTQLLNGYSNLGYLPQQDYDDVRGMTSGQKWANAGSSILTGASTGASIGGVPGAIVGGVIGGIGSLIGIRNGNEKARLKTMEDNMNAQIAMNNANTNLQAQVQRVKNLDFRDAYAHRREEGGSVERRQMDIKDFANRVMNKPVSRIVRTKCKGGVMIKINK